jgi:hypothetical protein
MNMVLLLILEVKKTFEPVTKRHSGSHAYLWNIPTVTEQELQAMRMGWFYWLTDINQPNLFNREHKLMYLHSITYIRWFNMNVSHTYCSPFQHAIACYTRWGRHVPEYIHCTTSASTVRREGRHFGNEPILIISTVKVCVCIHTQTFPRKTKSS